MIRHLPADVRACIRTGFALTSFAQAVEELVLNGIDAGASSIAVRVDFSCFKVQVVDNGVGISLDQFQLVGERYSTSKCQRIEDLDNLKYFGYRGEALASIRTAASFLEIVSRSKASVITYSKCFRNGNVLDIIQASQSRPSSGTTVTAHDLFYNLPVRRKRLNGALEMEKIRYRLAAIALMWPYISFSLRDDSVGHVILQTHKCSGMAASFSYIFTPARARGLMEVSAERDEFKITGFVSKECYSRMDLQFVFVNKRLVLKSSIHRQINKILGRSLILRRKGLTSEVLEKNGNIGGANTGSPQKQLDRYAIFAVNVECPYNVYDITFDPSKTLVEFRDWPKLIRLLQDMLYGFLRKENLISISEPVSSASPDCMNCEDENDEDDDDIGCQINDNFDNDILLQNENIKGNSSLGAVHKFGKNISAVIENGLFSKPVHRPKNIHLKSILLSTEQTNALTDSKAHQTEAADQSVIEQSEGKDKSALPVLDPSTNGCTRNESAEICSHSRHVISFQNNIGNNFTALNKKCDRKSKDQIIQQSSFPCSLSSEHELVSTESLTVATKQNMNEDSEEVFVKGQTTSERREITLGNSFHYSSTLKRLRDINQASSSRCVSGIITNTLQQLRQSTQKSVKSVANLYKTPEKSVQSVANLYKTPEKSVQSVANLYKTPEKLTTVNEDNPSPTKQQKMDDCVKATVANRKLNETVSVSEEFVNTCTSKRKTRFSYNLNEHNFSNFSTIQVGADNVGSNNNMTLSGESNPSATFKFTKENRSLGQNDRGAGLKRSFDHRVSHASKLAKLMRGENIVEKQQEMNAENGDGPSSLKHTEILNTFSYSRSLNNVRSKHPKAQSSACIMNKFSKDCSQITDYSHEGIFLRAVNISQEQLPNHQGKTRVSDIDHQGKTRVSGIEVEKLNEQASSKTQASCSTAAYRECHSTLYQTRKQLGHAGNYLPFSIYRSALDEEQHTEDEVDDSPKVSVILSLPLDNVASKISQSETWDRHETTRPAVLSDLNRYNEELENDAGQNTTEPNAKNKICGATSSLSSQTLDTTTGHSHVQTASEHPSYHSLTGHSHVQEASEHPTYHSLTGHSHVQEASEHPTYHSLTGHSHVQEASEHPTYHSLTGIELMHEAPCFVEEHLPCQSELEAAHFGSSTQTLKVSQGFIVTTTQLNKDDTETSLDSANSPLGILCIDSMSNAEESASGFESSGFSPTSNVATDDEYSPHIQSGKTLVQFPEKKITDSPDGISIISHVVLLDSGSDIQNNIPNTRDREPGSKPTDDHCAGAVSSKSVSAVQIGNNMNDNESPYRVQSKLTFLDEPMRAVDTSIDIIQNSAKECLRHSVTVHESASLKESVASDEPVILAYDSLNYYNAFSTVPETDDTENYNLDRMEDTDADINLRPAAGTLSKGDSNCTTNSHCTAEDRDRSLVEVKSMIADVKHIFKNMEKSLGISYSSQSLFSHSFNTEEKTASVSKNKPAFGNSHSSENYPRDITETTAYFQLEKSGNSSSRTLIHLTSDCEQILLRRTSEESIPQECLSVSCTSSRDSIPCGQRCTSSRDSIPCGQRCVSCTSSRDSIPCGQRCVSCTSSRDSIPCGQRCGNNDTNTCHVSSHTDSLEFDKSYTGTGQTVLDNNWIPLDEPSSPGHLETALYFSGPHTSHILLKDVSDESVGHCLKDVIEKDCSQIPVSLASCEAEQANNSKNNSEFAGRSPESQHCNTSKHRSLFDSEEPRPPYLSACTDSRSHTDPADIMSIEGDQVFMMIEEPVQSPTRLLEETIIHGAENTLDNSESQSHKKSVRFPANREINFNEDWSEAGNNTVALEDGTGISDSHQEINPCMAPPKSKIELNTFGEVLIAGPSCLGSVKPSIVPSSLSLLRPAAVPVESSKTSSLPDEHLFTKDVLSENVDTFNQVEVAISNHNSLPDTRDASNSEKLVVAVDTCNSEKLVVEVDCSSSEKVVVDLGITMADANPTTCELVHKNESLCNQKAVGSQEGITITACWKAFTDPETGQQTYINNQSGHTVNEEQWAQMAAQLQTEMLIVPSEDVNVTPASGPAVFSASEKQAFKDLVSEHFEQEDNEAMSKWRKGERPAYDKNIEADVSALMASWKNPVFLNYKQPGLLADKCPSSAVARSCFNSLSAVEFNKNMLNTLKVIGQLDNKFIACVIEKTQDVSKAMSSSSSSLLVLFDQHAVHERIRLEHFTRDVYEVENGERTDRIKRSEVRPAQSITMDQDDLRIMKAFKQEFNRIGVSFSVDKASRDIVHITCFPSCLVNKDTSEMKKSKIEGVIENVETLIKEHIELLKSTNGACGRLPLTIHKVLCSLACHGAVKFGDKLTLKECQDLLSSLASCSLPFQCAHGRPSVAPLVNLSVLEKELFSAKRRLNLRKISEHLNK